MTAPTKFRTKMRTITLEVPEELAAAVEARGGHIPGLVERAMLQWIPSREAFTDLLDALHSIEPPMTQEEIDEELALWKAEKAEARGRASRS